MNKKRYNVSGMTCTSCENIIKKRLSKLEGVQSVKANYKENKVKVVFNGNAKEEGIRNALDDIGYPVSEGKRNNILLLFGAISIFIALYLGVESLGYDTSFAQIDHNTSYALLFLLGLVTGLHCIVMCGGFVLSYSLKQKSQSIRPHLFYGVGKLASYTAIGALFGLIGSAIAFTIEARIIAALLAGVFLIIFGLGMLNLFPRVVSGLNLSWINRARAYLSSKGPFETGIATGFFIACGPLQAMYVLAAGSGDMAFGALSLFFFGLGTLPVLLGFSYVSSLISRATANRITQYSGVIVLVLGMMMINNAIALSGTQIIPDTRGGAVESQLVSGSGSLQGEMLPEQGDSQIIRMKVNRYGFQPSSFVLRKGVPVKWIIEGEEVNGCNNEIIVREYGLDIPVKQGEEKTVEFTPDKEGTVSWSCWMGMIHGRFIVVDNELPEGSEQLLNEEPVVTTGSTCGMSTGGTCGGGGCGCGCGR